jgi:hypothetical protein
MWRVRLRLRGDQSGLGGGKRQEGYLASGEVEHVSLLHLIAHLLVLVFVFVFIAFFIVAWVLFLFSHLVRVSAQKSIINKINNK